MRACLLVAHGPATEALSESLFIFATEIESKTGVATGFAFLDGEERVVHKVLREMDAENVIVLPLFVSSGSYHVSQHLPALLKMGGAGKNLAISGAFDSSPELAELVVERAEALGKEKDKEALILLFHGSMNEERNRMAKAGLEGLLQEVRRTSSFAEVAIAGIFHDELRDLIKNLGSHFQRMIIIPLFFFEGTTLREKVPSLLDAIDSKVEVVHDLSPLFPSTKIYKWVARKVKSLE